MKVILLTVIAACVVSVDAKDSGYVCECDPCNDVECSFTKVCRVVGKDNTEQGVATCLDIPPSNNPDHWLNGGNPCPVGIPALNLNFRLIKCTSNSNACPLGTDCTPLSAFTSEAVCCPSTVDCQKEGTCRSGNACDLLRTCTKDSECSGGSKCCAVDDCTGNRCIEAVFAG